VLSTVTSRVVQHEHQAIFISTSHAHLDHERCVEVVVLRGKSRDVEETAGSPSTPLTRASALPQPFEGLMQDLYRRATGTRTK